MSEIIDTGLGWAANEDWLKASSGQIGTMSTNPVEDLPNLPLNTNPNRNSIISQGYYVYGDPSVSTTWFYAAPTSDIYAIKTGQREVCIFSFAHQEYYRARQSEVYPGWRTATLTSRTGLYGDWTQYATADINPAIPYIPVEWSNWNALLAALQGETTTFYKLNSGYAVACFVKWINANQQTVQAPIIVSTNQDFVKISLDGSTETPGIVTGIQLSGLTFYINVLTGYSGTIDANVPYADLTETFPEGANITELFRAIATLAQIRLTDPYAGGGTSEEGSGDPTFDDSSDEITVPAAPTVSFASTGFTRIYNPTLSQLNDLADYMWTDTTFLDTVINHLKQLLENPMDAIISLSLLPCSIPNGAPEVVKVMYVSTGVYMAPATTQFVDVDCGTYTLQEYYGSALDYNPYTKVHCYLPYIGQVTLDTDEVMGKTLNIKYRIDIVTGMCAVMILVDQTVMYQFSGHCAINMPINSADFSGYVSAAMTAGKMVAGVVAGATGNIPLAAELIGAPAPHTSTTERTESLTTRNPKTGRQVTQWTHPSSSVHKTPGASFGEMSRKAAGNTVGAVMGSKLTVEHAGGFTGNSGYLAVRRPYLIIERPRMCNPAEYGKYNGYPSMIYLNLGSCSGYTEVQSIQFQGITATNPELAELSELLKTGVIL